MIDDLQDDELEQRMRARLFGSEGRVEPTGFNDEELRIAERLLGRDNARNLNRARLTNDRFRYRRPNHRCEYYLVPRYGWMINLIENGVRRPFKTDLTEAECQIVVRAIKAKGVPIQELETEYMRHMRAEQARLQAALPVTSRAPAQSARKAMLDAVAGFRV